MAMTQATALTLLRDRLNERGTASETTGVWTLPQLRRYLNEAQRELARRSEALRKTTTTAVTAGTQGYTAPTDMARIYLVEFYTSASGQRYWLEWRSRDCLNRMWGTSQITSSGYPEYWTLDGYPGGSATIQLYPTPSANGTLKVHYYMIPTDLATADTSNQSSNLTVPTGWEDVLLDYAEYRALRQDGRVQDATLALQMYQDNLGALVDAGGRGYVEAPDEFIYDPYYTDGDW